MITQRLRIDGLDCKQVECSAELKLDLQEPVDTHGFGYGGGPVLLTSENNRLELTSSLDHDPHIGVHNWQPVRMQANLPKVTSTLRAGFLHPTGGW
jgi:hypothetical protein